MQQKIISFHLDEENHWVATLACKHNRHVRNDPPFFKREWVTSADGRKQKMGTLLNCVSCDEIGLAIAQAVKNHAFIAFEEAQADALAAGLCKQGQTDLIYDRINNLDLKTISQSAISNLIKETHQ